MRARRREPHRAGRVRYGIERVWALFPADAIGALAAFEPALAREATGSLTEIARPLQRIPNGLDAGGKIAACIGKAGEVGVTRSGLLQAIRPQLSASDLTLLGDLLHRGEVEARSVRVRETRFATRYFAAMREAA